MIPKKPAYPAKVFINGKILDASDATISVFDRGFIFGDGIYEVMAQVNGRFFYRKAHIDRLKWCLQQVGIRADIGMFESNIPALLEASGLIAKDCMLYMQVSRGTAPRQHSFPHGISPTMMMYAWPKNFPDIEQTHASVLMMEDFRWSRCDIKSTSLLGNVMANEMAMQNDAYETLLVRNGIITEASHCNVFFVKNEIVYTHPAGPLILDGITRQVVLELCEQLKLEVRHEGIAAADIQNMDEAFLTGTGSQVMAIKKVDGNSLFESQSGPVTLRLQKAFLEKKYSS
ncbi:MAG: aminotransferase class IV [Flavobacteriaceae bacterium]